MLPSTDALSVIRLHALSVISTCTDKYGQFHRLILKVHL